jgi:hypothetical protein
MTSAEQTAAEKAVAKTVASTVSTTTFRAWRKWLYTHMSTHHDPQLAASLCRLHDGLGSSAWAAQYAASGGNPKNAPIGAMELRPTGLFDNETFTGDTVELARSSLFGDPEKIVAEVVSISGIARE